MPRMIARLLNNYVNNLKMQAQSSANGNNTSYHYTNKSYFHHVKSITPMKYHIDSKRIYLKLCFDLDYNKIIINGKKRRFKKSLINEIACNVLDCDRRYIKIGELEEGSVWTTVALTTIGILLGAVGLYLTIVGAPAVIGTVAAYGMMFGGDTIAAIPTVVDICQTYMAKRRNMNRLRNTNNNTNNNDNNNNNNNNNNGGNNNYNSITSNTNTASLSESSAMTLPNGGLRQDFEYGDIVTITVPISALKKRNGLGHGVHVESPMDDCKNNYNSNTTNNIKF